MTHFRIDGSKIMIHSTNHHGRSENKIDPAVVVWLDNELIGTYQVSRGGAMLTRAALDSWMPVGYYMYISFTDRSDALLFKLTWI